MLHIHIKPNLKKYGLSELDLINYKRKEECFERKQKNKETRRELLVLIVVYVCYCCFYYNSLDKGNDNELITLLAIAFLSIIPSLFISFILNLLLYFFFPISDERQIYSKKDLQVQKYFNDLKFFQEIPSYSYTKRHYCELEKFGFNEWNYTSFILERFINTTFVCWIEEDNLKQQQMVEEKWWINLLPFDFEKEIAGWYEQQGYEAILTSKSGDGGVDVILMKDGRKIYVQCKHYASQVPINVLRELLGVMKSDHIKEGVLACLYGTSGAGYDFDRKNNITILTIKDLVKNIQPKLQSLNVDYNTKLKSYIIASSYYVLHELFETEIDAWSRAKEMSRGLGFICGVLKCEGLYIIVYGFRSKMERLYNRLERIYDTGNNEEIHIKKTQVIRSKKKYLKSYY